MLKFFAGEMEAVKGLAEMMPWAVIVTVEFVILRIITDTNDRSVLFW
jgi:hypothetical protein